MNVESKIKDEIEKLVEQAKAVLDKHQLAVNARVTAIRI